YKTVAGHLTFSHPESLPVQLFAELGLVMGAGVILLLAWAWLSAARRRDLPATHAGLLAGLAALAIHDLSDFASSFGGVSVPAAVAFGILLSSSSRRGAVEGERKPWRWTRARRIPTTPLALVLLTLFIPSGWGLVRARGASADEMVDRMVAAMEAGTPPGEAAAPALRLRPSDHMPSLVAARACLEHRDSAGAIEWINLALYLAPTEARAHLLAAEALARAGRKEQALLQYRLAAEWGEPASLVLSLAAARYPSSSMIAAALPESAGSRRDIVRFFLREGRHEDAWSFGREALEMEPQDDDLMALLAQAALVLGRHGEAAGLAERLVETQPRQAMGHALLGRSLMAAGREEEAVAAIEQGLRMSPGDPRLSLQLARVHIQRRRDTAAGLAVLDDMRLPDSTALRAGMHALRGAAHASRGRTRQAMEEYRTAARLRPEDPSFWVSMGDYLMRVDQYEKALEAYVEARRRSPGESPGLVSRIERAEERVEALRAFRDRRRALGAEP
ncbi:MAG: tetratricopeptide repeat protein, partial [Myxococcota bacterium]